jgi:FkbM family methyltransferase
MEFYKEFREIIERKLKERSSLENIISQLKDLPNTEKIAFYPSGVLTGRILKKIKTSSPELIPRIAGCFDKSNEATTEKGFDVFNISELNSFKKDLSLLVVASNTFYDKERKALEEIKYDGNLLQTSSFDLSLPQNLSDEGILLRMDKVYNLLSDKKSKAVYMMSWLSRMLNDQTLTHLFEKEEFIDENEEPLKYKGFIIDGIDHTCKKELHSELYKMKHVFPEKDDVVFDVGAYKGDTPIFFAYHVGKAGKIYAFEPIPANFKDLIKNIKKNNIKNIFPINMGLSDAPGVLKGISSSNGAPWSYLSHERGNQDVTVTTIDDYVESQRLKKVDFIKMDVEGLEQKVISGAKKTITQMMPKLAIALYHNTSDLITLPLLVDNLGKGNYNLYIRSKIEGPWGFTLYSKRKE